VGAGPAASSELVRRQMSSQRRADTAPEVALRRALHARGLRFRTGLRVGSARPDILLTRARVAVFVMGDFWHSCPAHGTRPKANGDWWAAKLDANVARDRRQRSELEADGWLVDWAWECEPPTVAADRIAAAWARRTGRDLVALTPASPMADTR
jgi:DNA mismatch endonuclease (patch repair protein)